jgi:hypothetical protein
MWGESWGKQYYAIGTTRKSTTSRVRANYKSYTRLAFSCHKRFT